MSLDVLGFIDDVFQSNVATRSAHTGGSYVDGLFVEGSIVATAHNVNVQPVTNGREIEFLQMGGERVGDARVVYVNDGLTASIAESDKWTFTDIEGTFKTVKVDNRPTRNYCRVVVVRVDT